MSERFERDGLVLWYGTADAPAPFGAIEPTICPLVTVGVRPIDASNRVSIDYRVNHRPVETMLAAWLCTDVGLQAQYFRARFPLLGVDDVVSYVATFRCAGRQVPAPELAKKLPSSFRIVMTAPHRDPGKRTAASPDRGGQIDSIVRSAPGTRLERGPLIPIRSSPMPTERSIDSSLTAAFEQVPEVRAGQRVILSVTGGTESQNVTVTDVDVVLVRPGPGGRTIAYAKATPGAGDWRTWLSTLALPALPAGTYPLFADVYGRDRRGKLCYKRVSAAIQIRDEH